MTRLSHEGRVVVFFQKHSLRSEITFSDLLCVFGFQKIENKTLIPCRLKVTLQTVVSIAAPP